MPRPTKHQEAAILSVAARLVADGGPAAATMTAIGRAMGAPNGSLYHRFGSRDALLGRLWLEKAAFFQNRMAEALAHPDPTQAALQAALSIPRAAREDFDAARIMMLHRREDFLSEARSPAIRAEAERLGDQVKDMLTEITLRLFGENTRGARETATFAIIDLPLGSVRRHVAAGRPPLPALDGLIEAAHHAAIAAGPAACTDEAIQ
jgi:AcrR family transcriptional regulator